uniref:PSI-F n=1 Tax=Phaeomonas parva TaxID=124430 RepID=A0A7S1UL58_9STRA|mmetsp:Transcript_7470/g.21741  ORF Transcript_7470/g.21741 Transcript_7470/m.21741 type:complete len:140 (+) Transcript_7470:273-692(+)
MMRFVLIVAAALLAAQASAFSVAGRRAGLSAARLGARATALPRLNVFDGKNDGEEVDVAEGSPTPIEVADEMADEKKPFELDYDPNAERVGFLGLRKDFMKESLEDPQILLQLAFSVVLYGAIGYYVVDTIRILSQKGQ